MEVTAHSPTVLLREKRPPYLLHRKQVEPRAVLDFYVGFLGFYRKTPVKGKGTIFPALN
jgi:hypothetical protein